MNFVSKEFWFVFLAVAFAYFLARRFLENKGSWDRRFLLALSLLLFACESWVSFSIFLAIGCWIYFLLLSYPRASLTAKKFLQVAGVSVALAPLIFFKYWRTTEGIPIGLSFYTFQLLSLFFDSIRNQSAAPSFRDYWSYASFFPQIVAGPIERRTSLLPQLQHFEFQWNQVQLQKGIQFLVLGFFYKLVVADNLAGSSNWITSQTDNAWAIHAGNFLFGFRIYFDFCGYSLIAFGLAALIGIKLTLNFRSPYWQVNPQEFWRCWHVSLSRWFRDYLYIPLGGNQARFPALLILLVFTVSGIWHGAGWNFVIWGMAHGVLLVVYRSLSARMKLPKPVAWGGTLFAMMTCWLAFYQTDFEVLSQKWQTLFHFKAYLQNPYPEFVRLAGGLGNLAYALTAVLIAVFILLLEGVGVKKHQDGYGWSHHRGIQVALILATVILAPVENNGFVYFDF